MTARYVIMSVRKRLQKSLSLNREMARKQRFSREGKESSDRGWRALTGLEQYRT